jgi:site-specific DNA-methyltransferase (adenine-specific)
MTYQILHGNNLDILPTLPDNSIDSIVTDPPYELGFMGKKWDSSGIAYSVELWQQCLRVLKPGGHLLSFGGTRTYHRVAVAIEDAGFELRDSIAWLYGSGFPKSLDVSKAIDKAAGAERQVIGTRPQAPKFNLSDKGGTNTGYNKRLEEGALAEFNITAPSTPEAQTWQGWGTALKPAFEPVIVARKPIEGTVANNVLKWGTGGLNIDGSRIGTETISTHNAPKGSFAGGEPDRGSDTSSYKEHTGRWPANVILGHTQSCQPTGKTIKSKTGAGKRTATFGTQDTQSGGDGSGGWSGYEYETEVYECVDGCPVKLLDEQSGTSKSPQPSDNVPYGAGADTNSNNILGKGLSASVPNVKPYGDSGGASRFFYVAKASKRDRNEGLEDLATKVNGKMMRKANNTSNEPSEGFERFTTQPAQNFHPTVKPTSLMEYLIKLVTPPNGTVLDPFTGSGSTGKAAILQGFDFIGIEMTEEYLPIIEGRLKHAEAIVAERIKETSDKQSEVLF